MTPPVRAVFAIVIGLSLVVISPAFADAPNRSDAQIAAALAARKSGDFDAAQRILQAVVTDDPRNARALHELATLLAIHGELAKAAAGYESALAADPTQTASRRALAEVLRGQGRCDAALPHLRALKDDPASRARALRGTAVCEQATGNRQGAIEALDTLASEQRGTTLGAWAAQRRKLVDNAGADAQISAATAQAEGARHFAARRYGAAAAWFEHACRTEATPDRCYQHGIALLATREFLAAVGALRTALKLDPAHAPSLSAWPTAARMLRGVGAGGLQVDLTGGQQRPATQRAAQALLDGDLLLARRIADSALKASGGKGVVLRLERAEALLRDGFFGAADKDLRFVLGRTPAHPVARAARAELMFLQGRVIKARNLAGLTAPPTAPVGASDEVRAAYGSADRDLQAFAAWRRAAFDHRMRMLLDPGVKPPATFAWRGTLDVESLRAATAPPAAARQPAQRKPRRRKNGRRRGR